MIIIFLGLLLMTCFIFDQKNFIFSVIIFYVVYAMFDGFYKEMKVFAAIRYILPALLLILYIIANKALRTADLIFFIVAGYLMTLLIFNHGNLIWSAKHAVAILIALMMLIVGRFMGSKIDFLKEFEPYNRFLLISIPIYIVFSNIFHIGESYSSSFTTGFLETNRMYIVPIVTFLGIQYILSEKKTTVFLKSLDITFIFVNIVIMIVTTRRTSLLLLLAGIVIYSLLNKKVIFQVLVIFVVLMAGLILAYPLYKAPLEAQLEERERIQNLESYDQEGRYLETFYLYQELKNSGSPSKLFFGIKFFDSVDFGIKYFGVGRGIHSDINFIMFSTGLVGVLLFLILIINYLIIGNAKIPRKNRQVYYPLLAMFFMVLIPGRFIANFTYAPFLMLALSALKHGKTYYKPKKIIYKKSKKVLTHNISKNYARPHLN
ncbi:hypothetical protein [Echinicola sp. 20G]|uniref:hypothetical protein n=1 Tax=Echinicola sp. 20G TaxID=2781961 RepID=UPI00190FE898|nr:hypothetical protein [Echinicola sp. 20G]